MDEQIEAYRQRLEFLVPINNLSPQLQNQLFADAHLIELRKGETLFHKGDSDPYSFYLIQGSIDLSIDGKLLKHLDAESNDARQAMAQLQPRQMSARAASKGTLVVRFVRDFLQRLLTLEQQAPDTDVTALDESEDDDWMTRVIQSELFSRISSTDIQKIFSVLEPLEVVKGDAIIKQDEDGDFYYIIQQGRCEVSRRISASGKNVRLAILRPGDGFGEEALIGNSTRNATVTMLTDGMICRMTKSEFCELIKAPVVQSVDYESAQELIATGASWLDVRFADEHAADGIADSLNIPVNMLRVQTNKLNRRIPYITYSTTGVRAEVAAYLLVSLGFNASSLKGGLLSSPISSEIPQQSKPSPQQPATKSVQPQTPAETAPKDDDLNQQAARLEAGMAHAEVQLQEARRLKAEVEKARHEVERMVAERLAEERKHLDDQSRQAEQWLGQAKAMKEQAELTRREVEQQVSENLEAKQKQLAEQERLAQEKLQQAQQLKQEAEQVRGQLEQQVQASLQTEREAIVAQEKKAAEVMQEAERMKTAMQQAHAQAEAEIARRMAEREAELQAQQQAVDEHLQTEESRLRELYEINASKLSQAEEERLALQQELEEERRRAQQETEQVRQQLEQMQQRLKEQQAAEQQLRAEAEQRLQQERREVESQLAKQIEIQELLRREKHQAELARQKASEEAKQIIEEYKYSQQQRHQQELQALKQRQQEIEAAAAAVKAELEQARQAQQRAESERSQAHTEVQQARRTAAELDAQVRQLSDKAERASSAAEAASDVVPATEHGALHSPERSEAARSKMSELSQQLEADLQNWVEEQERIQSSTLETGQRQQFSETVNKIQGNADAASQERKAREDKLFNDVAALLDGEELD